MLDAADRRKQQRHAYRRSSESEARRSVTQAIFTAINAGIPGVTPGAGRRPLRRGGTPVR